MCGINRAQDKAIFTELLCSFFAFKVTVISPVIAAALLSALKHSFPSYHYFKKKNVKSWNNLEYIFKCLEKS